MPSVRRIPILAVSLVLILALVLGGGGARAQSGASITVTDFPSTVLTKEKIVIQYAISGGEPDDHSHVHWWTSLRPVEEYSGHDTSPPYRVEFRAPAVPCTVYAIAHARVGTVAVKAEMIEIQVAARAAPTIAISSVPVFAETGDEFAVEWVIKNGTPSGVSRVKWWSSIDRSPRFSKNSLKAPYRASIGAPSKECAVFLQAEATVGGTTLSSEVEELTVVEKTSPVVTIVSCPETVGTGDAFEVSWSLSSGKPRGHSHLHWEVEGKRIERYSRHDISAPYASTIKAPKKPGSLTLRAQVKVGSRTYYSEERRVVVSGTAAEKTKVDIVSCPSEVRPGEPIAVEWAVTPTGSLSHSDVHWGTSLRKMTAHTRQDRFAPHLATVVAPKKPCTVYLKAHVRLGSKSYDSEVRQVVVREGGPERKPEPGATGKMRGLLLTDKRSPARLSEHELWLVLDEEKSREAIVKVLPPETERLFRPSWLAPYAAHHGEEEWIWSEASSAGILVTNDFEPSDRRSARIRIKEASPHEITISTQTVQIQKVLEILQTIVRVTGGDPKLVSFKFSGAAKWKHVDRHESPLYGRRIEVTFAGNGGFSQDIPIPGLAIVFYGVQVGAFLEPGLGITADVTGVYDESISIPFTGSGGITLTGDLAFKLKAEAKAGGAITLGVYGSAKGEVSSSLRVGYEKDIPGIHGKVEVGKVTLNGGAIVLVGGNEFVNITYSRKVLDGFPIPKHGSAVLLDFRDFTR